MKLFLVILALVALTHADGEWKPKTADEIKTIRSECIKEHPLSEEVIEQMKHFNYPDEEHVRKYLLCTAEKLGIFCEHEGYHADRVTAQFSMDMDKKEVLGIVENCLDKNEQGSPVDVWAFRGHKCLMSSKIGDKVKAYIKNKREHTEN